MKKYFLATLLLTCATSVSQGQDVDIEFGLDDLAAPTTVVVVSGLSNSDGTQILDGAFSGLSFDPLLPPDLSADNPGFITPASEGLLVNSGDEVFVRFLNAGTESTNSVGGGFVSFFDPNNAAAGVQAFGNITVSNSSGGSLSLNGASLSGDAAISLGLGADGITGVSTPPPSAGEPPEILGVGEIHTHLTFDLQDEATTPAGVIGLFGQFEVDLAATGLDGVADVTSSPFFLLLNANLDDTTFRTQGFQAFGVTAVPEPTTAVLLTTVGAACAIRRRRRP